MTDKQTGGPAFPTPSKLGVNDTSTWIAEIPGQPGMTLRDYFAAKAMQGMYARVNWSCDDVAIRAYEQADAMLKAREL